LADQRRERVAGVVEPGQGGVDGPSIGSQVRVVEFVKVIGMDTGAPEDGRGLNGATRVLLIAFWV
jgi:hypothetical protein